MKRKKNVVILAHCILNQNSVVRDWERAQGGFTNIILEILQANIGIIQLPCPEFSYLGENRPPMTKNEYETDAYHKFCKTLIKPTIQQIEEYLNNGYHLKGIVGISDSPSCDIKGVQGIFMEELFKLLDSRKIKLRTFEIPEQYIEGEAEKIVSQFKQFLNTRN